MSPQLQNIKRLWVGRVDNVRRQIQIPSAIKPVCQNRRPLIHRQSQIRGRQEQIILIRQSIGRTDAECRSIEANFSYPRVDAYKIRARNKIFGPVLL